MTDGIVNLLKPTGLTSSDAVVRVRRALGRKDAGHLGTLDPFAAGVLPVAVGKATRLFDYFLEKRKLYRASVLFGYDSPTLDTDGACTAVPADIPSEQDVVRAAARLVGTYPQIPPAVSAKSVGGRRAYELARQGRTVELPAKTITVESMEFLRRDAVGGFVFDVRCSSGTYVRALARDLGALLGVGAVLCSLIRLRSGEWTIADSVTTEELCELGDRAVIPTARILEDLPRAEVDASDRKRLENGVAIPYPTRFDRPFTVWCEGALYGLGKTDGKTIKIGTYLKGD